MLWWLAVYLPAFLALWLYLIAPGRAGREKRAPFLNRAYAHRGLYEADQSVPENSLPAFSRAAEAGYGVELDVQLSRDGRIVVFHDDDLRRACGLDARVEELDFEALRALRLFGGGERIPLFSEALETIGGRVPLIVELKAGRRQKLLCERTREALLRYDGACCVESFHPAIVRWFYRNAPELLRGQLSEAFRFSRRSIGVPAAFAMSRLLLNCLTRPDFIAYRIGPKCLSVRLAERLGAMRVAWTARDAAGHARIAAANDAVIFEAYRPPAGPPH
ncbi:MAG: glycerophosphodiester phosphodiesterase family protein [Clostridia bacterium]|nr:glycerophosphodiester phosphodiesterase family protein [Clostridia bacterium]